MLRTFRYRLYPNKEQSAALDRQLRLCKDLYNVALDQRRTSWRYCKESISYTSQANELPDIKSRHPEFKEVHSQVLQDVLKRVDRNYKAFFRRVEERKKGKKVKAGHRAPVSRS